MAENKSPQVEREYTIPLKKQTLKVPRYERTSRAVKTIKQFVARHMKVPERDLKKVKLDVYFNNQLWIRGRKKPPAKIKVKVKRDGENIIVDFVEVPEHIKFLKQRQEKIHKKIEKKKVESKPEMKEEPKEEKTEGEKKEEKEKAQSAAIQNTKEFEKAAKTQKHTTQAKTPQTQRKALKK
jgi:ribosomal protein L31E